MSLNRNSQGKKAKSEKKIEKKVLAQVSAKTKSKNVLDSLETVAKGIEKEAKAIGQAASIPLKTIEQAIKAMSLIQNGPPGASSATSSNPVSSTHMVSTSNAVTSVTTHYKQLKSRSGVRKIRFCQRLFKLIANTGMTPGQILYQSAVGETMFQPTNLRSDFAAYERWKIVGDLEFIILPECQSTQGGAFYMYTTPDGNDDMGGDSLRVAAVNNDDSNTSRHDTLIHNFWGDKVSLKMRCNRALFVDTGYQFMPPINDDIRISTAGSLIIGIDTPPTTTSGPLFSVFVSGVIEFWSPNSSDQDRVCTNIRAIGTANGNLTTAGTSAGLAGLIARTMTIYPLNAAIFSEGELDTSCIKSNVGNSITTGNGKVLALPYGQWFMEFSLNFSGDPGALSLTNYNTGDTSTQILSYKYVYQTHPNTLVIDWVTGPTNATTQGTYTTTWMVFFRLRPNSTSGYVAGRGIVDFTLGWTNSVSVVALTGSIQQLATNFNKWQFNPWPLASANGAYNCPSPSISLASTSSSSDEKKVIDDYVTVAKQ